MEKINIIGGGLAGSEAALYLAERGYKINLYEMRPKKQTGAHTTGDFAEFVCSNSLGSIAATSASGLLKKEIEILGSNLITLAKKHAVPSGNSLSIDRFGFSNAVSKLIKNHKNINIINDEVEKIPEGLTLVATGPLTSSALCDDIKEKFGEEHFSFFDAIAPIVKKDTINFNKAFYAARWDKGEADFINCPFTREEYLNFYEILNNAEKIELKEFEKEVLDKAQNPAATKNKAKFFEGCMPIEQIASRGVDTLRFGPMKPVGLFDRRLFKEGDEARFKKQQFYAVVQLRQDDKEAELYNLVGFQTNLKWGEQKKLIQAIPGLENAEITRYGVMHANTFINSPKILNKGLQTISNPDLFFAGQITGVEGYAESIATGLLAGINIARYIEQKPLIELESVSMLGALVDYITFKEHKNFQPINSNWGIIKEMEMPRHVRKNKEEKNTLYANRAIEYVNNLKNML